MYLVTVHRWCALKVMLWTGFINRPSQMFVPVVIKSIPWDVLHQALYNRFPLLLPHCKVTLLASLWWFFFFFIKPEIKKLETSELGHFLQDMLLDTMITGWIWKKLEIWKVCEKVCEKHWTKRNNSATHRLFRQNGECGKVQLLCKSLVKVLFCSMFIEYVSPMALITFGNADWAATHTHPQTHLRA